jgi:hypothetical protein
LVCGTTHVPAGFDALAAVRGAVALVCEVDAEGLSAVTRFDDVGADSLARVSIADLVELSAPPGAALHIPDAELCRMQRLGELADYAAAMVVSAGRVSLRRTA